MPKTKRSCLESASTTAEFVWWRPANIWHVSFFSSIAKVKRMDSQTRRTGALAILTVATIFGCVAIVFFIGVHRSNRARQDAQVSAKSDQKPQQEAEAKSRSRQSPARSEVSKQSDPTAGKQSEALQQSDETPQTDPQKAVLRKVLLALAVIAVLVLVAGVWTMCPKCIIPFMRRWISTEELDRSRGHGLVTRTSYTHGTTVISGGGTPDRIVQSSSSTDYKVRVPVIRTTYRHTYECAHCQFVWSVIKVEEEEAF